MVKDLESLLLWRGFDPWPGDFCTPQVREEAGGRLEGRLDGGWREDGGRLRGGWREAERRLRGSWREAEGRLEGG